MKSPTSDSEAVCDFIENERLAAAHFARVIARVRDARV